MKDENYPLFYVKERELQTKIKELVEFIENQRDVVLVHAVLSNLCGTVFTSTLEESKWLGYAEVFKEMLLESAKEGKDKAEEKLGAGVLESVIRLIPPEGEKTDEQR